MSNEITYQAQVLLRYAGVSDQFASGSKVMSQTDKYFMKSVQTVGFAAHEAIDVGGEITAGNIGYVLFANLDATNFVEIGKDVAAVFYPMTRLKAGEFAYFRWEPGGLGLPYAKADTAAVDLFYIIYAK